MSRRSVDESFMRRCIDLARRGAGAVSPNPMVGCVIVKGGRVLASGFHRKFGAAHAERDALQKLKGRAAGATLYVSLEPCSHYGKTPPCVDAIIASGVSRVVIGTTDPNPLVAGGGIPILRDAGIDVVVGVCEEECRDLNRFFLKYIQTGRPYVLVKIAQSLDGYIASPLFRGWFTSEASRKLVHTWRTEYDAVVVGAGTVNTDNPSLSVRSVPGRQPKRIVIDGNLSSDPSARIFHGRFSDLTYLVVEERSLRMRSRARTAFGKIGIQFIVLRGKKRGVLDFGDVLRALGLMGISSVLVEGGAKIFDQAVHGNHADELAVFVAPVLMQKGIAVFGKRPGEGPYIPMRIESPIVTHAGRDMLLTGKLAKGVPDVHRHR